MLCDMPQYHMANYRRARINDEVARVLSDSLREVKDPRVREPFITITSCEVSVDLRSATVFFSVRGADKEKIKEFKRGLYSAACFLPLALAEKINLRITPELSFEYDGAMERGAHISVLLKRTASQAEEGAEGEKEDGNE